MSFLLYLCITKMEKQFIPYTEALALKKLEFDEKSLGWYCNDMNILYANMYNGNAIEVEINYPPQPKQLSCYAPLWQQAFDFFNEKFKLASHVDIFAQTNLGDNYYYQIVNFADVISPETTVQVYGFKTSYDAKLACLKKLITYLQ